MTAAPYPADTRAKGWRFELDYERIEQSDTWAMAAEVPLCQHALLMMWLVAWKEVPCGSFPNDEAVIRAKCRIPPSSWSKVRAVLMRGWSPADDGRLYHPVLTERVSEMLEYRAKNAKRVAEYKAKMREQQGGNALPTGESPAKNDTGTGTGTGTSLPTVEKKARAAPSAWAAPDWVPVEQWSNFVQHRKAMRGVPFTDAARDGVVRELARLMVAGHDPAALLETAVVRGWRTVFEPKPHERAGASPAKTFRERDEENAAARVFEMTGGLMGRRPATQPETIDADPVPRQLA